MFSKAEKSEEDNSEGIGIGLFVCKQLVENSGGEISVFSDGEGKGSKFSFTMEMKSQ